MSHLVFELRIEAQFEALLNFVVLFLVDLLIMNKFIWKHFHSLDKVKGNLLKSIDNKNR